MAECDGCGKERADVQPCGRDANGDPDAPDLCFVCRVEWQRSRRVYSQAHGRYVHEEEVGER
jgi:hypothetical protein